MKTFEANVLTHRKLNSLFFVGTRISMVSISKIDRDRIKIINSCKYIVNDRKKTTGAMCHAIYRNGTENNKYMKNCNKKNKHHI